MAPRKLHIKSTQHTQLYTKALKRNSCGARHYPTPGRIYFFCWLQILKLNYVFFYEEIINVNSSDPDQAQCLIGPELGPNCLHSLQQRTKIATSKRRVESGDKNSTCPLVILSEI